MRWLCVLLLGCSVRPQDHDGDGWLSTTDCDDRDPRVAPGNFEIPYDGLDNDCDRRTLDRDADLDGVELPLDCNDSDPSIPSEEVPYDGVDNDCDEATRDDDVDGDGFLAVVDCDDNAATAFPGGVEVPYDGLDNDCDPSTPDGDLDGDGLDGPDDCDDEDPEVAGPVDWFEDCDEDGYAPIAAEFVNGCEAPSTSVDCAPASWTDVSPLGLDGEADCNDDYPQVNPGQTSFFTSAIPGALGPAAYDYDCDGISAFQYGTYSCIPDPATAGCLTDPGYEVPVSCGAPGTLYDSCLMSFAQCEPDGAMETERACR